MDWGQFFTSVVHTTLTAGILLPASIYVLKLWMGNKFELEFGKRLEDYKLGLNKQLEIHRALLANVAGRRIEAVVEAYRLLAIASDTMKKYVRPVQFTTGNSEADSELKQQLAVEVCDTLAAFSRHIFTNRPLFDDSLFDQFKDVASELAKTWNVKDWKERGAILPGPSEYELFENKVKPLLEAINSEARDLLRQPGVT